MKTLEFILFLFSRYIGFEEKNLAKNILKIGFKSKKNSISHSHFLIQRNHLALCLEVEFLFKGYSILNKNNRKLAFSNVDKIKKDFLNLLKKWVL